MGLETRVFWLILGLHGIAILLFTKGFLLTRTELPYHSHCSDITESPCFFRDSDARSKNPNETHQHCWTKPSVDRLVIIVLDALRFDFVAPSSIFPESKPWMDKLQVLQELASQNPSFARIFKAIADPPTTSLQRLKGLTTGGLPTFIDVGNSFGAPAIVEDNLLHQWVQNGKRVVMMGDDTWMQLFPHHFERSYPFPSFNVKDLDTVDNGCIEHLVPSLYKDDWDVLIAHFLGVIVHNISMYIDCMAESVVQILNTCDVLQTHEREDHAGHIFGVESVQMLEKLEQYNAVLLKVVEVLKSQSEPGGLHENTLLLVMGDHGQTVNGDHGGGSPEEVETSIFAMSFKKPPLTVPSRYNTSSCEFYSDKENLCMNSIQQLDFAVTISALLGIPFPFGSIGHVNRELYALGAGSVDFKADMETCKDQSNIEEWLQNYVNALCINSWQVKRYIDVYSASSVIGFSHEDLLHVVDLYAQAAKNWSYATRNLLIHRNESCNTVLPALKRQIDLYSNFLLSVAELARSKWTEFNLRMMGFGFVIMLLSVFIHILSISKVKEKNGISFSTPGSLGFSFGLFLACIMVVIRACSFLSNSYILEEGKVACFLLATSVVAKLRDSIKQKNNIVLEVIFFLILITVFRVTIEVGISKQTPGFDFLNMYPSWLLSSAYGPPVLSFITEIVPIFSLVLLAIVLYKAIDRFSSERIWNYVIVGTIVSYMFTAVYWATESNILNITWVPESVGKNSIPQLIYAIGLAQVVLLMFCPIFSQEKSLNSERVVVTKAVAMLAACSPTIIILLGKQGPLVSIAAIIGGYCIVRLGNNSEGNGNVTIDPLTVTQWSLLAVCLFFCTGHWCGFDGLRYGAAFIGFDEFVLVRQAILLTIDTFGLSLILPIFGLPFLVSSQYHIDQTKKGKDVIFARLSLVYMLYGLIMAVTVTATMMCVAIHRRHLMVWGLFAPKFVFDVVGLLLTDVFTCLASLYYFQS